MPAQLGRHEMSRLVHEDQDAENDDQGQDGQQHYCLTLCRASSRAHRSAARTSSTEPAGAGACESSTRSMVSLIIPNGIAPSRKAATATSLAALNTAGAVPPGASGGGAQREGRKGVGPNRLEGQWSGRDRIEAPYPGVGEPLRDGSRRTESGSSMEGNPSCASTLPSWNSTKACTMLWGWTTTSSAS